VSDFKKAMIRRQNVHRDRERASEQSLKRLAKKIGFEYKTREEHRQEILDKQDYDYRTTPIEKRQMFLDLFHAGKNVGEAREAAGISLDVAIEILKRHSITVGMGFEKKIKE
jgi:phage terminase large subunit